MVIMSQRNYDVRVLVKQIANLHLKAAKTVRKSVISYVAESFNVFNTPKTRENVCIKCKKSWNS
jgi:ABC-type lipoprotein export system ATPase subunit